MVEGGAGLLVSTLDGIEDEVLAHLPFDAGEAGFHAGSHEARDAAEGIEAPSPHGPVDRRHRGEGDAAGEEKGAQRVRDGGEDDEHFVHGPKLNRRAHDYKVAASRRYIPEYRSPHDR